MTADRNGDDTGIDTGSDAGASDHLGDGMTVGQLADIVGMTPRNIRAYQSRGLLFPPTIRARVARYTGAHVARLQLIASLQREGFTLAAIKRAVDTPASYAAIVADRRRRWREGDADSPATVPVSEQRARELLPELPARLTETGLVWADDQGRLVTHPVLAGVARTLLGQDVPSDVVVALMLEPADAARRLGDDLRDRLNGGHSDGGQSNGESDTSARDDLAKLAVQLAGIAFELAFLAAAADGSSDA